MTNTDDCMAAVDLSVDFIGFVFYRKSARYIEPKTARRITDLLAGRIKTVGVFVEETGDEVREIVDYCNLDFAQVYGEAVCDEVKAEKRISAYRVGDRLPGVAADGLVLFDSYTSGFGGSGVPFNMNMLKGHSALDRAFIAGGVSEENVAGILQLRPFGIDLVSSIEKYKGKKDVRKMKNLVKKVRSAEI
ncbi:MAG: N-(5'-phosphoribosyl)anthranilate isomerase [Syntrophorhabdus sp. PtaU1.Bin058]|nr:MAG: N-(5'-phosphoribosyl)anthranilate isomerase [Syntrophorhabdus sp. PtaU1.Bin058]